MPSFCFVERKVEQDLLDFVLGSGSSYMESDVREATDQAGFCRSHFKKMFDYGNTLGNGWILKTHFLHMNKEMHDQFRSFTPQKTPLMGKLKKNAAQHSSIGAWAKEQEKSCYICKRFEETYSRYLDTFFVMYKKDGEFRDKVKSGKGFCLPHFGNLCNAAETRLSEKEKAEFYPMLFTLMENNMKRLSDDVAWLVEKFDYRNQAADWKNSKDAVQRGMQKLAGGYPADDPYKMNK